MPEPDLGNGLFRRFFFCLESSVAGTGASAPMSRFVRFHSNRARTMLLSFCGKGRVPCASKQSNGKEKRNTAHEWDRGVRELFQIIRHYANKEVFNLVRDALFFQFTT